MDHTTPVLEVLRSELPATPFAEGTATDTPTIGVDREHIVDTLRVLRDHALLQFAFLVDVIGVDYHPATPRYEIVYHLACLGSAFAHGPAAPARRLRVKVRVPGDDPVIASIVPVFRSANWPEREIFDLFGIHFEGHPDLRRILMPEDWEGYPLRKDYPVQIRKDTESWSPAQLTAEEFAENIRAQRARASRDSHAGPKDAGGGR